MVDEVDKVFEEFWLPIVRKDKTHLDSEQIKKELYDFYNIMQSVPKVYGRVTGGKCTNILTDPDTVIALFEDYTTELVEERIKERDEEVCEWTKEQGDYWESNTWQTSCNNCFEIMNDGPLENDFKYCCYCGKTLSEVKVEDDS